MKYIYFIVVLMLYNTLSFTQNYNCILIDDITHFKSSDENILSIRIDSINANNDTIDYYSYRMFRTEGIYFTIKGASWIGDMYRVLPNGNNVFYNALNEPILFKMPVSLNSSWEMYHSVQNNIIVTATISSIESVNFLGLTDSVATITFNVSSINGNAISNPINNYSLKLSKNYGFIKIFNFYCFPFINQICEHDYLYNYSESTYISDTLVLIGIENSNIGWQNLTSYDIYNWEQDWEFHNYDKCWPTGPYASAGHLTQTIRKILDKNLTTDSVSYTVDRCFSHKTFEYETLLSETFVKDTIIESYNLNSTLNHLSFEPFLEPFFGATFYVKKTNSIHDSGFSFLKIDNETFDLTHIMGGTFSIWLAGMGSTSYGGYYMIEECQEDFVYYKKDSLIWGIPYLCSNLLNEEFIKNHGNDILIYPNPNSGSFNIHFPFHSEGSVSISIIDISGKQVFSAETFENHYYIRNLGLDKGLYFVIISSNNVSLTKKIIFE